MPGSRKDMAGGPGMAGRAGRADSADAPNMAGRKLQRDQADADMREVLKRPEARRVLAGILAQSNLMHASYAPADALATAYNEGLRAVGLWLKKEIDQADPDAFARLLAERRTRK